MFIAGVPWWHFLVLAGPAVAGMGAMIVFTPFRVARLMALQNPWALDNPTSYQPRESLMAVLGGGWTGLGLGNGFQKLGYLPEVSTDFIFAHYCEEWGFFGAVLLMGLVAAWIWHARRASLRSGDSFGRVLAASVGFLIASQAVMHMAVNLVAIPPTGVPFPFMSAGGTALVMTAFAAALLVSVTAHRADDPGLALTRR